LCQRPPRSMTILEWIPVWWIWRHLV
jgi:hypothetical protein